MKIKRRIALLIDIALPDDSNVNTNGKEKLRKYKTCGDRFQQDVVCEDNKSAGYNWNIENN